MSSYTVSEPQPVEIVTPLAERPSAVREIVVRNTDDLVFLKQLATAISGSRMFNDRGQPVSVEAVAVKILVGQELGIGPISSMMNVHVISGRVTLSANLMAATIKRHRLYDYRVGTHTTEECTVHFLERGRPDEDFVEVGASTYTMADADAAELGWSQKHPRKDATSPRDPDSPWVKHPRAMLFARALSNGARWYTPDVFYGLPVYVEGEIDGDAEMTDAQATAYFHGTEADAAAVVAEVTAPKPEPVETEPATLDSDRGRAAMEGLRALKARPDDAVEEMIAEGKLRATEIPPDERAVSPTQLKRLGVLAGQLGFTDLQRHDEAGVTSWNHLSYQGADAVIKDWTRRLLEEKGGKQ